MTLVLDTTYGTIHHGPTLLEIMMSHYDPTRGPARKTAPFDIYNREGRTFSRLDAWVNVAHRPESHGCPWTLVCDTKPLPKFPGHWPRHFIAEYWPDQEHHGKVTFAPSVDKRRSTPSAFIHAAEHALDGFPSESQWRTTFKRFLDANPAYEETLTAEFLTRGRDEMKARLLEDLHHFLEHVHGLQKLWLSILRFQ